MNKSDPGIVEIQNKTKNYAKRALTFAIVFFLLFIAILVVSFIGFTRMEAERTANIRDVFIIVLAIEALLIGMALFVLILQTGMMMNILQNQIKPILEDTQVTMQKVKSTTTFLAKYAVKPIIRMNSYSAGFKKLFSLIGQKK